MTEQPEITVDSSNAVFLAVAAQNYADADLAFWRLKDIITEPAGPVQLQHLDKLRERRKETYADLVAWVALVEAERLGTPPATPAKAMAINNIVITNTSPAENAREAMRQFQNAQRRGLVR